MPRYFIHVVNCDFESRDEGADYDRIEDAVALGVRSALGIAADEIYEGRPTAAAEVSIQQEDGTPVQRSVVVLTVSPLMKAPRESDVG